LKVILKPGCIRYFSAPLAGIALSGCQDPGAEYYDMIHKLNLIKFIAQIIANSGELKLTAIGNLNGLNPCISFSG